MNRDTIEQIEIPGLRLAHTGRKNQESGEQLARFDRWSVNGIDVDAETWRAVKSLVEFRKIADVFEKDVDRYMETINRSREAALELSGRPVTITPDPCEMLGIKPPPLPPELQGVLRFDLLGAKSAGGAYIVLDTSSGRTCGRTYACDGWKFMGPGRGIHDFFIPAGDAHPFGRHIGFRFDSRVPKRVGQTIEEFDVWQIKLNESGQPVLP